MPTGTLLAMSFPAIVLAAGASRRLGRPKQLLDLDGETLLGRTLRVARESGAAPVLAVLGAYWETICTSLSMNEVVMVLNERWKEGMATSIGAGLRALAACSPAAPGTIILGCDQPRLSGSHLGCLIERFHLSSGNAIVASAYGGVRGIPAVFPRDLFPRLLALEGDRGARAILGDPQYKIIEVPFEGGEIDIDVPADLDRLR